MHCAAYTVLEYSPLILQYSAEKGTNNSYSVSKIFLENKEQLSSEDFVCRTGKITTGMLKAAIVS